MSVKVSVDHTVNAAYIELSTEEVARTVKVEDGVMVDLDAMNVVVGIEVLNIDLDLPLQKLRDEFHVHSAVVNHLYSLRPNVGVLIARFQQNTEGVTTGSGVLTS